MAGVFLNSKAQATTAANNTANNPCMNCKNYINFGFDNIGNFVFICKRTQIEGKACKHEQKYSWKCQVTQ